MKTFKQTESELIVEAITEAAGVPSNGVTLLRLRLTHTSPNTGTLYVEHASTLERAHSVGAVHELDATDVSNVYHALKSVMELPLYCQGLTIEVTGGQAAKVTAHYIAHKEESEKVYVNPKFDGGTGVTACTPLCAEDVKREVAAITELSLYDLVEHEKFGRGIIIPSDAEDGDSVHPSQYMARFFRLDVAKYVSFDGVRASELKVVGKPDIFISKENGTACRVTQWCTATHVESYGYREGTNVAHIETVDGEYSRMIELSNLLASFYLWTGEAPEDAPCEDCAEDVCYGGSGDDKGYENPSLGFAPGFAPLKDVMGVDQALEYVDLLTDLEDTNYANEGYKLNLRKRMKDTLDYIERNIGITESGSGE